MLAAEGLAGGQPSLEGSGGGGMDGTLRGGFGDTDALPGGGARGFVEQPAVLHFDFGREGMVVAITAQFGIGGVLIFGINPPLFDVGEEGLERIKILGGDGVKLVIMAFRAAKSGAQPGGADHPGAVRAVFGEIFARLRPAFTGDHVQAVETGGNELLPGGMGQEIAGELLPGELIERLVVIVGVDHIIPVGKNALVLVAVIPHGIAEADHIQPGHRHAFAIMRRSQQPVHLAFPGIGALVIHKGLHFCRCGRQAGEVETEAAQQGPAVGFRRRRQSLFFLLGPDESVDVVFRPRGILHRGRGGADQWSIGPVGFIDRAFRHPAAEGFLLLRGEGFVLLGRGHQFVLIGGKNALQDFAFIGLAGDDGQGP